MIQRKQTLFLLAAIVMTVICLCMQIGSFKAAGLEVARVYNLWFTDPLGKHHFDTWPLFAVLLPTTVIATYTIFLYRNRKLQALFCLFNALLVVGWAVFPAIAFILYLMARRAINADEKLVRSMDRIR